MRYYFVLNFAICTVMCLEIISIENGSFGHVITEVVHKYFSHLQCICVISEKIQGFLQKDLKLPQFITSFRVVVEDELNSFYSGSSIKTMLETTFQQAKVG